MTLLQKGPVTVAADSTNWRGYSSGILDEPNKDVYTLNHAVVIVGYGEENGVPYWTIKNSWGEFWGENGYIRIKRYSGVSTELYNLQSIVY